MDRMTSQDGIPLRMQWLVPVFHFPFGFHSFRYMIFISITGIAGKCTTPSFEALTFICAPFQSLKSSLEKEQESRNYDAILINGVLMYINDEDIDCCLEQVDHLLKKCGFLYIKESVGVKERLTLVDFYSSELEANYNVIYRSIYEYTEILSVSASKDGVVHFPSIPAILIDII